MTIFTNINAVDTFVGGAITINDTTRVNIAPANSQRIRLDITLGCDTLTHCIELYDAATDGNLIAVLDREFTGVMIRDHRFYTMDKNAIYQGDIFAIIGVGPTPYDINVTEVIG